MQYRLFDVPHLYHIVVQVATTKWDTVPLYCNQHGDIVYLLKIGTHCKVEA